MNGGMSAIGPKQTWTTALHMSAFGGLVDASARKPRNTMVFGIFRPCKLRWGKQIDDFGIRAR
jgi:hypothetical protein